jgi:hypothetical protein
MDFACIPGQGQYDVDRGNIASLGSLRNRLSREIASMAVVGEVKRARCSRIDGIAAIWDK